jgi:hypothetical protein
MGVAEVVVAQNQNFSKLLICQLFVAFSFLNGSKLMLKAMNLERRHTFCFQNRLTQDNECKDQFNCRNFI